MEKTTERLYQAAKELKNIEKPAQLARLLNISQQTLTNWESRGVSQQGLVKAQSLIGVSVTWLVTGEGQMQPSLQLPTRGEVKDIHRPMLWSSNTPLPEDDYVFTPYLKESSFAGGAGSFDIPDYNGFRLPFGKATLYSKSINPDKVFCCTLTGDSMEPRIAEDAAIAVDTGIETIKDGKIYAFQHGELFRVKYLYRLPHNKVRIVSENKFYEDEIVDGSEIRVIGRVFWWSVLD